MKSLCLFGVLCCAGASVVTAEEGIRGFLRNDVAAERQLEQTASALPDPARLQRYLAFTAAEPHQAGSPRSQAIAEYIRGQLTEWGLQTEIERFDALLPYPTARLVEITGANPFKARLKEPLVAADPTSGDQNQLPTYNAYSASGDVATEVVYANFGLPEDYDWLAKQNISVKGKIVLTRYGKSWRGIKPKVAAEHGAVACLIYSDPHEDGYFEGDVYPKGPMRPPDGAQRGSVVDMPLYPGDPLTPGWGSTPGAKRLPQNQAKSLMTIPVLPLSYADATPIIQQLTGPVVPRAWRGALPLTYHAGPSAAKVHVKTDFDWTNKPLFDVIATIPGSEHPDQWIIVGNHHDAWVNGADDPLSGAVALLETARGLATLVKQGWRPKRTIKIAFWDGEEFGLVGSTEWAEQHADELGKKAVLYLNSDSNGRGWIHVGGSHTLEQFATEVAQSVQQPNQSESVAAYAVHHPPPASGAEDEPQSDKQQKEFTLTALGAGSDYVAFVDHLGVASMNSGFGGADRSGIYHSVYDSIYWYTHFSDGTFVHGKALAQYTLGCLLRFANSSVYPFEFARFANTVNGYVDEIEKEANKRGHPIDLQAVRKQLQRIKENGSRYDAQLQSALAKDRLDSAGLDRLNLTLLGAERTLIRPEGLPNRPWYRHQVYAPGFYTGYGVKTLPGIREAVESGQWDVAQRQAKAVAESLGALEHVIEDASNQVSGL